MTTRPTFTSRLLAAVLVVGGGVAAASAAGITPWDRAAREAEDDRQQASARIDTSRQGVARRTAVKEAVIAELLAGRTTLAEATDVFLTLNQSEPRYAELIRISYPGVTEQERTARNVIAYARTRAGQNSSVVAGLEAEFARMIDANPAVAY